MARAKAGPSTTHRLVGCGFYLLLIVPGYVAFQMPATAPPPPVVERADDLHSPIKEAAARYGVSEELIAAVIEAESRFDSRAVSRRGARGLMQLMPATAAALGVEDPFDPHANIHGGVRHLRHLLDRFDNDLPLVLAAYNAGEHAVIRHGGIPPYPETRRYVRQIMRRLERANAGSPEPRPRGPRA